MPTRFVTTGNRGRDAQTIPDAFSHAQLSDYSLEIRG